MSNLFPVFFKKERYSIDSQDVNLGSSSDMDFDSPVASRLIDIDKRTQVIGNEYFQGSNDLNHSSGDLSDEDLSYEATLDVDKKTLSPPSCSPNRRKAKNSRNRSFRKDGLLPSISKTSSKNKNRNHPDKVTRTSEKPVFLSPLTRRKETEQDNIFMGIDGWNKQKLMTDLRSMASDLDDDLNYEMDIYPNENQHFSSEGMLEPYAKNFNDPSIWLSPEHKKNLLPDKETPITKARGKMHLFAASEAAKIQLSSAEKKALNEAFSDVIGKLNSKKKQLKENVKSDYVNSLIKTILFLSLFQNGESACNINLSLPEVHGNFMTLYHSNKNFQIFLGNLREISCECKIQSPLQVFFNSLPFIDVDHITNHREGKGGHICTQEMIKKQEVEILEENSETDVRIGKRKGKTPQDDSIKTFFPAWISTDKDFVDLFYASEIISQPRNGILLCKYDGSDKIPFHKSFYYEAVLNESGVITSAYPVFTCKFLESQNGPNETIDVINNLEIKAPALISEGASILLNYSINFKNLPDNQRRHLACPLRYVLNCESNDPLLVIDFAPEWYVDAKVVYDSSWYYVIPASCLEDFISSGHGPESLTSEILEELIELRK